MTLFYWKVTLLLIKPSTFKPRALVVICYWGANFQKEMPSNQSRLVYRFVQDWAPCKKFWWTNHKQSFIDLLTFNVSRPAHFSIDSDNKDWLMPGRVCKGIALFAPFLMTAWGKHCTDFTAKSIFCTLASAIKFDSCIRHKKQSSFFKELTIQDCQEPNWPRLPGVLAFYWIQEVGFSGGFVHALERAFCLRRRLIYRTNSSRQVTKSLWLRCDKIVGLFVSARRYWIYMYMKHCKTQQFLQAISQSFQLSAMYFNLSKFCLGHIVS